MLYFGDVNTYPGEAIRLPDERYEFLKGEVISLFERCHICSWPINGFELAHKLGIALIAYSSLSPQRLKAAQDCSPDGFYREAPDGREQIFYNDKALYERTNMTLLHEIGHCVLDHQVLPGQSSEQDETEANFFAKYAAAPPPLVHQFAPQSPDDIKEAFNISQEAAGYAYEYYLKWLRCRVTDYTEYELRLLRLFKIMQPRPKREVSMASPAWSAL